VNALCKVCRVSKSGFYDWKKRKESNRVRANRALEVKIKEKFEQSEANYGVVRMTKALAKEGIKCNKKRVRRIMLKNDLKATRQSKFKPQTTDSNHNLPVAANILQQDFTATAPNQKWGCDITYIKTLEGWLYLAIVMDLFSRKIIGWALDTSLHAALPINALKMAIFRRGHPLQVVLHSDRGVQYACYDYQQLIARFGLVQSMSRTGNCYDNAMVESWFRTLKVEAIYKWGLLPPELAVQKIKNFIENYYNSWRLHSSLDYCSPNEYEQFYRLAA
jgi:transposase InsO family protein